MTTDERDTVLRMVDTYERLLIENSARKVVMKSLSPRPGEPTLEQQVATLIADVSAETKFTGTLKSSGQRFAVLPRIIP